MKRYISVFLCLAIIFSSFSISSSATGSTVGSLPCANGTSGYDFYTIDSSDTDSGYSNSRTYEYLEISRTKDFVKSLSLESRGFSELESVILDELDSLESGGVQLETYTVALPRATEYYGHFEGFMFQAAYTTYTEHYSQELSGKSSHIHFMQGLVNILMSCPSVSKIVTIGYSIFSPAATPVFTDTTVTQLSNDDEVTTRYIMIQDLYQQASPDKYSFIPVILDEVRISKTTIITFPRGPWSTVMTSEVGTNEFPSPDFYNKSYNLSLGYAHYISGIISGPETSHVPPAEFALG